MWYRPAASSHVASGHGSSAEIPQVTSKAKDERLHRSYGNLFSMSSSSHGRVFATATMENVLAKSQLR